MRTALLDSRVRRKAGMLIGLLMLGTAAAVAETATCEWGLSRNANSLARTFMKTAAGLLMLGAAAAVAEAATCGEALLECEQLCSTHGFVEKQECWGSPDSCVLCLCADGSDMTAQLPVKCTLDYCGYDCPSYEEEKACNSSPLPCGDWGVPCCNDASQVCDYSNRNPLNGEGQCQDLVCTDDAVTVSGLPVWHYFGDGKWDINGVYTRKAEHNGEDMGYAKYQKEVDGHVFSIYPYLSGSGQPGWTIYCESCGFLWLVHSLDFNLDIAATDPSSWVFQGNGGTQVCADPAVGQCWHDTNDISSIQVACGATLSANGNSTSLQASPSPC